MSAILPINLDALLHRRGVESERVEFKASWDPETTGLQVLRTICAFANDYHNLNGGYVVLGVGERDGRVALPPAGLSAETIEAAQKWIRGNCNRLDPPYAPVLSPETVGDRLILVAWAPGSEMRPHRAPARDGALRYWVRIGSETVDAEQRGDLLRGLIQQTARVPWDDRRTLDARVEDIREAKVREYLRDVRSGLLDEPDEKDIYRRMRITMRVNDHEVPRNAGLLFFSRDPAEWFRGARIEVVQFAADRAGNVQEERTFGGGLVDQLRDCLNYLENLSTHHLQKQRNRSQVRGWVSYPLPAVRETLVNAVYHRGYDVDQPEPTKVYLYPSRVEVISYPGPVPGIEARHLAPNAEARAVPARNRRIGEFLKELGLAEGRLTGLPKVFQAMEANGSPAPRFEFDEQRTYFQATLPAHPEYGALSALRDAAHLRALGEHSEAFRRIESAWASNQASAALATEMIRACVKRREIERAEEVLEAFEAHGSEHAIAQVANSLVDAVIDFGGYEETMSGLKFLVQHPPPPFGHEVVEATTHVAREGAAYVPHQHLDHADNARFNDPYALFRFALAKIWLAQNASRHRRFDSHHKFLNDAQALLKRVVQLEAPPALHAWGWRELARTHHWLQASMGEVEDAYRKAIELLPSEPRFAEELEKIQATRR